MTETEYAKMREKVGLKNWTRVTPDQLSNEDLAEFVQIEPSEHIVGSEYADGISVVNGLYAEIARRLMENEQMKERMHDIALTAKFLIELHPLKYVPCGEAVDGNWIEDNERKFGKAILEKATGEKTVEVKQA